MHWFDKYLGKYNLPERWVSLDYNELFLDPILTDITFVHEISHSILTSQTDFGLATDVIFRIKDNYSKISQNEVEKILNLLYQAQVEVQEGFATFREISRLRYLKGQEYVKEWIPRNLPDEYKIYLSPLSFIFELPQEYIDAFLTKVSRMSMETGIRKVIKKKKLMNDIGEFSDYIKNDDNNPNARLQKFCSVLKNKPYLLIKENKILSEECGVILHEPATKGEVADFLTYISSLTNKPQKFYPEQIGKALTEEDAFKQASDNVIVANLNLNLAEEGKVFFNLDDFMTHANDLEIISINLHNKDWNLRSQIKPLIGEEPEIAIIGLNKKDEKFLTITSKERAEIIINSELKDITLFVKWGGYDPFKNKLIWSDNVRIPELVVYNTIKPLQERIYQLMELDNIFSHHHLSISKEHPFHTLFLKINDIQAFHVVNCFGNKEIIETIKILGSKTKVITSEELIKDKRHINNLMSFWMRMPWEVDWIGTALNGKKILYRD